MKIAVLDDLHRIVATAPAYATLAGHEVTIWNDHMADVDVLAERLKDAEVLVLHRDRTGIPAALIERLPQLRLISSHGRIPNVDVAACTRQGVLVCAGVSHPKPDGSTVELTLALMLMGLRYLPQQIDSMKAGKWQAAPGRVLRGQTLGIYAYGRIGGEVAALGRAFGMKVQVLGRDASLVRARADGYEVARSREAFFSESDVVSLHMPLVNGTHGIVTEADLLLMKPTAMFINTSRAGLVAPGALLSALKKGRPGKAGVDVYEHEPITDPKYPLLRMPNVICMPHVGGLEIAHLEGYWGRVFSQVVEYVAGHPKDVSNPEALSTKGTKGTKRSAHTSG